MKSTLSYTGEIKSNSTKTCGLVARFTNPSTHQCQLLVIRKSRKYTLQQKYKISKPACKEKMKQQKYRHSPKIFFRIKNRCIFDKDFKTFSVLHLPRIHFSVRKKKKPFLLIKYSTTILGSC